MLRVSADDHNVTFSLDDLALLADLLNGRFHFHCVHHAFLTIRDFVYGPGDYFALQVILPFVRSYTLTSTVTLSPGRILI